MIGSQMIGATGGAWNAERFNLASVDLNLLVSLEALLDQRNVTHAGQRVGLSQPAMSRVLARLRGIFDDELLIRTAQGLTLTARAEQLWARLPAALDPIRALLTTRTFRPEEVCSRIGIAMAEHQALMLLPRLLPRLRARAPGLNAVMHALTAQSLKQLAQGEIALAIGTVDAAPNGYYRRTLYTDRYVCVVRRGHPCLSHAWNDAAFASLKHVVVAPRAEEGFGHVYDSVAKFKLPDRDPLVVPDVITAPIMVGETDLAMILPHRVALRLASTLPLAVLNIPNPVPEYEVSLIWHDRCHRDDEHGWLRSEIAAACISAVPAMPD